MISGKDRNEILCVAPGVWLFLRERHLSHRLLAGYYAIVNALCTAWNALTPDRLLSLTRYPCLNQGKF